MTRGTAEGAGDFRAALRGEGGATVVELNGFLSASGGLRDLPASLRGPCALDATRLRGLDGAGLFDLAELCVRAGQSCPNLHAFGLAPELRRLLARLGFGACLAFHGSRSGDLSVALEEVPAPERAVPEGWLDPWEEGPALLGPLEGFGELWEKSYRLPLPEGKAAPEEAARLLRERLPELWPPGNVLAFPASGPVPGAVARIELRLVGRTPLRTGALVLHRDDTSFTLGALAGHVEAGWIRVGAASEQGRTVLEVRSLGRGADPLYEAGLRLFGHAAQERFWRATLERAAEYLGVPARVEVVTSRVDDRVRWEAVANVRHSAALREPVHLLEEAATLPKPARRPAPPSSDEKPVILVLGGGYGGLACLRALSGKLSPARYRLRLLDATPYHTIKTRFHERAVLESREALLRLPLDTLAAASGALFLEDEVTGVDLDGRAVHGRRDVYRYDRLVLALGGRIAYFGVPGAAEHTVSLQTYEQAVECCRRVATLRAEGPGGPRRRLVVVGAGIEGLEVATMLRQELPASRCEILVLDRGATVMAQSQCSDAQREHVRAHLDRHGVDLRLGAAIRSVAADHVVLETGERLPSDLTVWCSGVVPAAVPGLPDDFRVGPDLRSPDYPDVFAVGDFAAVDSPLPAANLRSAQRAAYQGDLAGRNLCRLEAGQPLEPARYRPLGELVALGDFDGVGVVLGAPLTGLRAALLKKAHEGKYLAETLRDVPGAVARGLLAVARKGVASR